MNCGEWSDTEPADGDLKMITKWFWNISEGKTNRKYQEFKAVERRLQIVAGTNYVIKVHVGENDYVHLQIFQSPLLGNSIETRFVEAKAGYK